MLEPRVMSYGSTTGMDVFRNHVKSVFDQALVIVEFWCHLDILLVLVMIHPSNVGAIRVFRRGGISA